jgi:hypothetical protein
MLSSAPMWAILQLPLPDHHRLRRAAHVPVTSCRLEKLASGWLAWAITLLFLGLQHATLPLIIDGRFVRGAP